MAKGLLAIASLFLLAMLALWWMRPAPVEEEATRLSVMGILAGEADLTGFARVEAPRAFEFPADHGPHPEYRHEWWYVTGNVKTAQGRHFGYQVTFFRFTLNPEPPARRSLWASNQLYMAHFAVTDTEGEEFHHFERFSRAALDLAGAQAEPFRVWLDDWALYGAPDRETLRVEAAQDGIGLTLRLRSRKPLVLQGDRGYSRKGPEAGNASHYYSFTRLATEGELRLGDAVFEVAGDSWLDREWGSSALGEDQVGWDWFSLQLDDGRELMFFHLRRADGSIDPLSHGVLVEVDGRSRALRYGEVEAEPLEYWSSPLGDGTRYPLRWRMRVPAEGLELELIPRLHDQELRGAFRYWEGALRVEGSANGEPVSGQGYMELTGY
ncbi:lipocalin-like domain-containing protein [Alkalilimnicola ehrlichii]|nr:lipocalin-like domain-containing protein [Alkalilimnicola ehrlichii]